MVRIFFARNYFSTWFRTIRHYLLRIKMNALDVNCLPLMKLCNIKLYELFERVMGLWCDLNK